MLLIGIIIALRWITRRDDMEFVCKENILLPSGYSISNDEFRHWKMARKLKMLMQ